MATKSGLITAINGFITSVVNITKHRDSMLEVVNELFPTEYVSTGSSGGVSWTLKFTKSGNNCHVIGSVANNSGATIGNAKLLTIPHSLYYPKFQQNGMAMQSVGLTNSKINFLDSTFVSAPNSIYLTTNLGNLNSIIINQTYIVND